MPVISQTETVIEVPLKGVTDGDTITVAIGRDSANRKVRILALDTEEVHSSSNKPVTELGRRASDRAKQILAGAQSVRLAIPGRTPFDPTATTHLDIFGRVLAYVETLDGLDFQEIMIAEGLSPYAQKYGYAANPDRHRRYLAAEKAAQTAHLGIWDQVTHNGAVMRDYPALAVWWDLRARLIEIFRAAQDRPRAVPLLDPRADYERVMDLAARGEVATLFLECEGVRPTGGAHHLLIGPARTIFPFDVLIRKTDAPAGAQALRLAQTRYLPGVDGGISRSFFYVTGPLQIYTTRWKSSPEIVVTRADQFSDTP